jgi:anion-transporting  ArsA/GET3 family ATPase
VLALEDRQLIYVTGKGGAGRTTVAHALALLAARAGRRTVICELAGLERVPALHGAPARPAGEEQRLEDRLWATSIDGRRAIGEWFATVMPGPLAGLLMRSGSFGQFADAAPGGHELAAMAKAWELARPRRWTAAEPYDVVVVDGPASGHGLGMLRTPATYAAIAAAGPLAGLAREVSELIADPARCAIVVVAQPAELSVAEALAVERGARVEEGRPIDAIVVNGVAAPPLSAAELERLAAAVDGRPGLGAAGRAAAQAAERAGDQRAEVRRLRRAARAPVRTLPWLAVGELELQDVRALATVLGRRLAA